MALLVMAFWLSLNGRIAFDTLIIGAAITAVMLLFGHITGLWTFKREKTIYLLLPGGVFYFFALFKEIFIANMKVIKLIFNKKESPCVRSFKTELKTKAARAVLANSITLTPGTVTIELKDDELTVHCLTQEMAESLTDSSLEKRLLRMEEKFGG